MPTIIRGAWWRKRYIVCCCEVLPAVFFILENQVTMTKRHLYILVLCVLACIFWIAIKVAIRSTTFGKSGAHEHWVNTSGMQTLSTILTVHQSAHPTNAITTFNHFYALVKAELPDATGMIDDSNPFPGILPSGHKYSRILEIPRDLGASGFVGGNWSGLGVIGMARHAGIGV